QAGRPAVEDDVGLEVDDALDVLALDTEQLAQDARRAAEEPHVDDRGGQLDVPHALAADAAVIDLHAAALAIQAAVLDAAVLAAGALVVLLGAEDALAEEAALFGAVAAVVDSVGPGHLARRPAQDVLGA